MFESLSGRLADIFDRLKRKGALSEDDVAAALREIRIALIEADVALPVVKDFVNAVREKAVGQEVLRSVTPGQMVVKLVHDHLVATLGGGPGDKDGALNFSVVPPAAILMVGLQGSGKTTTAAKIARLLQVREKKKVLLASLDVARPAAQEQLATLARQIGGASLPIIAGEKPVAIAKRAMDTGKREGYDAVILDTAGRLHIDEPLMQEIAAVHEIAQPAETLLVVDSLTGQDAVNLGKAFAERVALTGIVLTRIDGDARGGAALSMRAVTGKPIKFLGTGEKLDALEAFHAERVASRILGMGDIVSLVEKASETADRDEAEKLARKLEKGGFDLDDLASQLKQLRKMGGMGGILGHLPGVAKVKKQLDQANVDEGMLKRQEAILSSMTRAERKNPKLLNASRRQRIAAGSGTTVPEINRLIKQYQDMALMMKRMGKLGQKGLARHGISA
ncbi:MAG: signal recognition particle protein, partial [Alphaproteobacteria bacterium]|nr:signal recognition particle protein [Alphaproteobacteria bacterium]